MPQEKTGTAGGLMPEEFLSLGSAGSAASTGSAGSKGQGGGSLTQQLGGNLVASRLTRVRPIGGRMV